MDEEKKKKKEKVTVSKDDVISKLKDDGDFDNLRIKIIHKLKDNEELRNSIISIVKQSAALNRTGAENMKPRQLSDAIFEDVGNEMMSKLSDGVWEIIRSGDGMKKEITETVESVYSKLVEPERKEVGKSSTQGMVLVQSDANNKGTAKNSAIGAGGNLLEADPHEPPGFSLSANHQIKCEPEEELQQPMNCQETVVEKKKGANHSKDMLEADGGAPPGFSTDMDHKQPCDGSDDDPDVPPGFG